MTLDKARRVLGVTAATDITAIRRRYHALARELHPDAGGSVDDFRDLQLAYALLLEERPRSAVGPGHDRDEATRRAPERSGTAVGPAAPEVDLGDVDWSTPRPNKPVRVDVATLALAVWWAGQATPVLAATARSRGPKARLPGLAPHVDDQLTARLRLGVHVGNGQVGVQVATERRALRKLLLDGRLPHGWSVGRPSSDTVVVSRATLPHHDPRGTALRLATVAADALTSLNWPLRTWMLTEPLLRR